MERLVNAVQSEMAFYDEEIGISKRTIQRDIKEIGTIKYSKANNGYYISDDEGPSDLEMMLEPLHLLPSLGANGNLPDFVYSEKRKPKGMEHLPLLIYALKHGYVTQFFYRKYDNTLSHTRHSGRSIKYKS